MTEFRHASILFIHVASRAVQTASALRTTKCWRYCRFAKQICSYSSIGTDTRCCSNGAGFVFNITFCWCIAAVGAGFASPNSVFQSPAPFGYSLLNLRGRVFLVLFVLTSPLFEVSTSRSNLLNDGTVKNIVKARFCSGVSEEMFKVR